MLIVSWKPQRVCTIYEFVIASVACDDEPKTLFLITSIDGKLIADGTQAAPITFTSEKDDVVCGIGAANEAICDTNNDSAASLPAIGNWGGVVVRSNSNSLLNYIVIRYSGASNIGALRFEGAAAYISNSTIVSNYRGIEAINAAVPTLRNNVIANNTDYGVYNGSSTVCVDAQRNWWGTPSGPSDPSNSTDSCGLGSNSSAGNKVTNNVDYRNWLTASPNTSTAHAAITRIDVYLYLYAGDSVYVDGRPYLSTNTEGQFTVITDLSQTHTLDVIDSGGNLVRRYTIRTDGNVIYLPTILK